LELAIEKEFVYSTHQVHCLLNTMIVNIYYNNNILLMSEEHNYFILKPVVHLEEII